MTTKTKVIIGSRESVLAVLQSEMVRSYIEKKNPGISAELLTMKTTGDRILDRTLDKIGGKGLFVKELDRALLDGRSDISVHSLKDMPMEVPEELLFSLFPKEKIPGTCLSFPRASGTLTDRNRWAVPACAGRSSLRNCIRTWR